jgi:hypothetical protein
MASTKPKAQAKVPEDGAVEAPMRLIVRRGALQRFDQLKRDTAELPVTVTWDRRLNRAAGPAPAVPQAAQVTAPTEGGDRRSAPPFTWETADFLVAAPERDDA